MLTSRTSKFLSQGGSFRGLVWLLVSFLMAQLFLALVLFTPLAQAAGLVTACTEANLTAALAGGGIVKLACDGTITLSATITISADTTLDAGGRNVILSGGSARRLFTVNATRTLTLRNLSVNNGQVSAGSGAGISNNGTVNAYNVTFNSNQNSSSQGGAIVNNSGATLNVFNSFFTGNSATNGAAIANAGTANINNTTFSSNSASGQGGAIANNAGGTLTVTNSTLANNNAGGQGGGLAVLGGTVTLNSVTFSGNQGQVTPFANSIINNGGTVTVNNSIVASAASAPGSNCSGTIGGTALHNLQFPGTTCGALATANPLLGTLNSNGGPTQTIALQTSPTPSPAIGAGTGCPATDQRYAPRSGACDLGAFQTGSSAPAAMTLTKAFSPLTIAVGGISTITFTIHNPNALTLTNVAFVDFLPAGMTVAATPNVGGTCTGITATLAADRKSFGISGISAPTGNCTVTIDVTSDTPGNATNVVDRIFASETGQIALGNTSGALTVLAIPALSKVFSPGAVQVNTPSVLIITVRNPNSTVTLHNINFTDQLPGGANVAYSNVSNNCSSAGASVNLDLNSLLTVSGNLHLGPNQSCTIQIDVLPNAVGTYTNTITSVSSTETLTSNISVTGKLTVVTCANPLSVTSTLDDGTTCNTLRVALSVANPGDTVSLQAILGQTINVNNSLPLPPLEVPAGVQVVGRNCPTDTDPNNAVHIKGDGTTAVPFGLKLDGGGAGITGLKISNFNASQGQLVAVAGSTVKCTQVSKAPLP
jgi:uncharacterized repeat protein (TIGR01451 family)